MNARFLIPNSFTLARLLLFPGFLHIWYQHSRLPAFGTLLLIVGSDALDGYTARKLDAASPAGAWFDVCADFAVVFGTFTLFAIHNLYPFWLLAVIAAMFAQFLLTNLLCQRIIYDPFGKYFGRLLFVVIGVTVLLPTQTVCLASSVLLLCLSVASLLTRWRFLRRTEHDLMMSNRLNILKNWK